MGRITGFESKEQIPSKVLQLYQGVIELILEGVDIRTLKVSDITRKAGIGKGTAYDYFDTREEIIVSAILYVIICIQEEVEEELAGRRSFFDQMGYLLEVLEEKMAERECFLHFIHLLTDTSICGLKLQERMKEAGQYPLVNMLVRLIAEAVERGELRSDLPIGYLCYAVSSQIVCFMASVSFPDIGQITTEELKPHILREMRVSYGNQFRC
ncbi:MAG: TetR/AcrR family transcriptional regulator [bacterium]|nr:TetR/AcrR family transcriptional regulator [bacterium]MCM1376709.1 TetR/AcrR family transcriptional regulator [Muribaculum sp.]